ncbi:MAG: hypothetical protein AAGH71_02225 [Planctomycetota bacterium]
MIFDVEKAYRGEVGDNIRVDQILGYVGLPYGVQFELGQWYILGLEKKGTRRSSRAFGKLMPDNNITITFRSNNLAYIKIGENLDRNKKFLIDSVVSMILDVNDGDDSVIIQNIVGIIARQDVIVGAGLAELIVELCDLENAGEKLLTQEQQIIVWSRFITSSDSLVQRRVVRSIVNNSAHDRFMPVLADMLEHPNALNRMVAYDVITNNSDTIDLEAPEFDPSADPAGQREAVVFWKAVAVESQRDNGG